MKGPVARVLVLAVAAVLPAAVLSIAVAVLVPAQSTPAYKDPSLPFDRRVDDLISRMTVEEKISQMMNDAPAIERLGVPAYNWWNECLHGVAHRSSSARSSLPPSSGKSD